MRNQTTAFLALLILAACSRPTQQEVVEAPQASRQAENVIEARNWTVRDGQLDGARFIIQPGSLAFVQNSRAPVAEGDAYSAEMVIAAENAATATVRISNGCGTLENDQSFADYTVQPGENTLRVHHTFVRPSACARLSLSSRDPLSYTLARASLTKQ